MLSRNVQVGRGMARLCTASVLVLGACAAGFGSAQAATPQVQLPPHCTPVRGLSGSSTEVSAINEDICISSSGSTIEKFDVTVSRLVSGSWVVVASGLGVATYVCVGTTSYEYSAVGTTGTYACG
jgi:hypothetical protein